MGSSPCRSQVKAGHNVAKSTYAFITRHLVTHVPHGDRVAHPLLGVVIRRGYARIPDECEQAECPIGWRGINRWFSSLQPETAAATIPSSTFNRFAIRPSAGGGGGGGHAGAVVTIQHPVSE